MPQKRKKTKRKPSEKSPGSYSFEFRLRVVRMRLEEKYSPKLISETTGVGRSTINAWVRRYQQFGEEGLKSKPRSGPGPSRVDKVVKDKIIEMKKSNPVFGVRRISDFLKRFFLLKASPATVHKTLSEADLLEKKRPKQKKNPPKPRFFERSTPNQLWQSDICTFRLAGKNAYLIGYIDDYSRYITGLGLYRSQTAEHVLETYRRATGEYGVPKEMLTDNGRQYVNWRGTTKFEKELQKDRIKHIRSRPHHPMTLGKIERFWKTILQEFLLRCQFDSFEDAKERLKMWVKYYNHRRPHQGICGLCPADRYFEIQHELKQTIARGIADNCLELALRGKPQSPFYMVGRMNGQNVVIRAEKGKVRMMVDEDTVSKELVYDMQKENSAHDNPEENQNQTNLYSGGETQGSPFGLDGTADRHGDLPGDELDLVPAGPLAESGNGGDVVCVGTEKEGKIPSSERPAGETSGEKIVFQERWTWKIGESLGGCAAETAQQNFFVTQTEDHEKEEEKPTAGDKGTTTGGGHHESPFRSYDCYARSSRIKYIP
ncbi:MAG: IS481 family transposase [Desulfobulbaceae bacterium]|nr:IS481 family transposase [Desulfobulbaceae bacterium]